MNSKIFSNLDLLYSSVHGLAASEMYCGLFSIRRPVKTSRQHKAD